MASTFLISVEILAHRGTLLEIRSEHILHVRKVYAGTVVGWGRKRGVAAVALQSENNK